MRDDHLSSESLLGSCLCGGSSLKVVVKALGIDRLMRLGLWVRLRVVMVITDVVAPEVTLMVVDQGLEIEVWKFVHNLEHDILQELIIELRSASQNSQIASMLGQATVHHGIVLVVSIHNCVLEPLIVSVADEALAAWKILGAIHLAVAAEVGSEALLLADCVLHERPTIVHLAVNGLAAHPLISSERCLVNVHDLEPGAH